MDDVTSLDFRFETFCPNCKRVAGTYQIEPQNCQKCGALLIFISLDNLPEQYKMREGKIAVGAVLVIVSVTIPILLMFLVSINLILICISICWIIGGIVGGGYLLVRGMREWNMDERKLIETHLPSDVSRIPITRGVKIFELGKLLAGEIYQCPDCGFLITRDAKFCKECGAKL